MNTTRRSFLQLLGFGGAAMAVAPMFGSVPLIGGSSKHYVYDKLPLARNNGKRVLFLSEGDTAENDTVIGFRGVPSFPTVDARCPVDFLPNEDPYTSFYFGAEVFRDQMAASTRRLEDGIRADWGNPSDYTLVTIAHTPIMAIPNGDKGFFLAATFSQFAMEEAPEGGEPISRNGEYPVNAPSPIDMKVMMMLEQEAYASGLAQRWSRKPLATAKAELHEIYRREVNKAWGLRA